MSAARRLRWGRILLGGLVIELVMFAIFIPMMTISETAAYYAVPVAGLATAWFFGRWVASGAGGRRVLHGGLTAGAASVMWLTLVLIAGGMQTTPVLFHVTNVVRVLAGAAGGASAQRRRTAHPGAAAT